MICVNPGIIEVRKLIDTAKQNGTYVICRTMFCETCQQRALPEEGTLYAVFGHLHQTCWVMRSGRVPMKHYGFTPHIVSFDSVCLEAPYVGYIKAVICCGVCGVRITKKDNGKMDIEFIKSRYVFFPPNEWAALKDKWKNTGYEL